MREIKKGGILLEEYISEIGNDFGQEFKFYKDEKVPHWIFECDVAYFGTDVVVIPEQDKVVIKSDTPITNTQGIIEIRNFNKELYRKVCPEIHMYGHSYLVENDGTISSMTKATLAKMR